MDFLFNPWFYTKNVRTSLFVGCPHVFLYVLSDVDVYFFAAVNGSSFHYGTDCFCNFTVSADYHTHIVGNTALAGTRLCLLQEENRTALDAIARQIETVELSFSPVFSQAYIENMGFEV